MKFSEAKRGRVFIIRLEDGEIIHEEIERFAKEQSIAAAALIIIGGADADSRLVVGPQNGRAHSICPMEHTLENVYEITGTGTLFPDGKGNPVVHMHIACGRKKETVTGCIRKGVKVWHVMEIILYELTDTTAQRMLDSETGFELLSP